MSDGAGREDRSLTRIIGFSDSVFAFAMTLLAVGLVLPPGTTAGNLPGRLAGLGPHFFVFALSFGVIGLYWSGHRRIFHYIERVDDRLLYLNLLLLLTIAFMPFPTVVYGEFGNSGAGTLLYAGTLTTTSLVMTAIWGYATRRRRLVAPDLDPRIVREHLLRSLGGAAVFGLSIPFALVDPPAARAVWYLFAAVILVADLVFNGEWFAGVRRKRAQTP